MVSSLTSLDTHFNQNKKNSTLKSPTSCFLTLGEKNKEKNFHHRNSTMGFYYLLKPDKSTSSFSSFKPVVRTCVTSNINKSNDETILEINNSKLFSFVKEKPSESEKMRQINKILNNKELKKKEMELCKLLKDFYFKSPVCFAMP